MSWVVYSIFFILQEGGKHKDESEKNCIKLSKQDLQECIAVKK